MQALGSAATAVFKSEQYKQDKQDKLDKQDKQDNQVRQDKQDRDRSTHHAMQAVHRCSRRRAEINLNREPQAEIPDRDPQDRQKEIPVQGRLLRSLQRSLPLSLCLPWRGT